MAIHQQNASTEANTAAYGKLVYILGYLILGIGAIYADVMFVTLLGQALPSGALGVAAILGAFLTSASLIALVVGKSHLFRPGDQVTWAWIFTWIEIGVMSLNVILAALHGLHVDAGYLEYWLYLCPATPFVAVIGWIMLIYADPRRHALHEDMAMADQLEDKQRQHKQNVHMVRLELQTTALDQQRVYMQQYMQTPEVQAALRHGSEQIALGIVSEIIQRPIMPASTAPAAAPVLPSGPVVDSKKTTNPRQPAARPKKKTLPRQRTFTPATPPVRSQEEREREEQLRRDAAKIRGGVDTEELRPPLARRPRQPVRIKRGTGTYVVNRRPAPTTFPTND